MTRTVGVRSLDEHDREAVRRFAIETDLWVDYVVTRSKAAGRPLDGLRNTLRWILDGRFCRWWLDRGGRTSEYGGDAADDDAYCEALELFWDVLNSGDATRLSQTCPAAETPEDEACFAWWRRVIQYGKASEFDPAEVARRLEPCSAGYTAWFRDRFDIAPLDAGRNGGGA